MPTCLAIGAATTSPTTPAPDDGPSRPTLFYDDLVRPACEQLGLTLLRADGLTRAGLPADQLLRLVAEADIVVVDSAGLGEELSFGLGMRHALGRHTVHVATGTGTSPGAGRSPVVDLSPDPAGPDLARRHLTALLADAVGSAPAALCPPTPTPVPAGPAPAAEPDEDAPGVFDLIADAEAQLEAIGGDMVDVESALTDLGAVMELVMEDMNRVGHPGASMQVTLAVINRLARAIDGPAGDLESAAGRIAERMRIAAVAFGALLDWTADMPRGEWPDGLEEVLDDVIRVSADLRAEATGYQGVLEVIDMMGASSRQLRRPARRIGASFRTIFRSVTVFEEWQGKARVLKQV